jgi:hypothetical protein
MRRRLVAPGKKTLTVPVNEDGSLRLMSKGEVAELLGGGPQSGLWDFQRDGITQGFLENLVCPERLRLKYVEGWEKTQFSGALKFGNIVHYALDRAYSAFRDSGNPAVTIDESEVAIRDDEKETRKALTEEGMLSQVEEELEQLYGMAEVLMRHYWKKWKGDLTGRMKWEALEETFKLPYTLHSQPYGEVTTFLRGKVDGRYRAKNRKPWIVDHKSKGEIQVDRIADRLTVDIQIMLYSWATKQLTGEYPAGVLYNVMRRPQLYRRKDESLAAFLGRIDEDIPKREDFYFVRFEAAFSPADHARFEKDLASLVRLAHAWSRGTYHYRFSPACETKYGVCEFLPVCARGSYDRLRKREHVFPELVQLEV